MTRSLLHVATDWPGHFPNVASTIATLVEAGADDAAAFAQWNAARRRVERGAHVPLQEAAALGLMDRVERCCTDDPPPTRDDHAQALWYACHGGSGWPPSSPERTERARVDDH